MAKTESTAVNELINLVQSGQSSPVRDPDNDLFAGPKPTTVKPPRMTATIPPMRGAGEIAPLPRTRAPGGTSQLKLPDQAPPNVRMTTAPVSRGQTIPPIAPQRGSGPVFPAKQSASGLPAPVRNTPSAPQISNPRATQSHEALPAPQFARATQSHVALPQPQRATSQPALPQPQRATSQPALPQPQRATSQPALPQPSRPTESHAALPRPEWNPSPGSILARGASKPTLPMPKGTRVPAGAPVAAPFEPPAGSAASDNPFAAMPAYPVVQHQDRIDLTGDAVSAENWFEQSRAVEKFEEETFVGTAPVARVRRQSETATLVKKMIVPTVALVIVGIMIGGFIAFNGEGGKQHKAKAAKVAAASEVQHPTTHVAAPSVAHPSPESANAATATAGADQPEPPAPADKAEAPKSDDAKTEAAKTAPAATSEPAAKTEAAKSEPAAPSIAAKSEPAAKTDAIVAATTGPAAAAKTATAAKTEPAVAPAAAKTEPAVKSAAIATAAPSAIHEIQTTRGVVKLVDVRIDSKPAGATVMLVDNGKTTFLGTTPIATSLDPSRSYDVIFTLQGRPTQMTHLDPAKQPRLEMTLGKTGGSVTSVAPVPSPAKTVTMPAPTPKAAPAATTPASAHHHSAPAHAAPAPLADPGFDSTPAPKADKNPAKVEKAAKTDDAPKADAPKADAPKADKKPAKVEKVAKTDDAPKAVKTDAPKADKAVAGQGTLMVSSKPPCEIWIDGKSTGLTTPQRAIPLPAGTHKVTFQNTAQNITKTVAVSITADQTTKLVKDLLVP